MTYRDELLDLLRQKSCLRGKFALSSGGDSNRYVDCKLTTLDARGAFLVGNTMLDILEERDIHADAIGGPEIGAIPIVSAVAAMSYVRAQGDTRREPLSAFFVRKEHKGHGRGKQIEGLDVTKIGSVVVIDEVCTRATSISWALDAVEQQGLTVAATIVLVDRQEGGHLKLEDRYGSRYLPIFTANELFEKEN